MLEKYAGLASLRTAFRGLDPAISAQLEEIRDAAEAWRTTADTPRTGSATGSAEGTDVAGSAEPAGPSSWLSTVQVGDLLRVTPRAVVKAIARGELEAQRSGRAWRISPEAVDNYRLAARERNRP